MRAAEGTETLAGRRIEPLIDLARCLACAVLAAALVVAHTAPSLAQSFTILRLTVGVVAPPGTRPETERYEPFRAALANELGTNVEIQIFQTGQELVDAAQQRRIDYGVYTASTYAAAWRQCGCIEPLVAAKSVDGTAGVRSILVVRNDGGLKSVADLKGKTLAASPEPSIAGRLVPFSELTATGSDPQTLFARIDTVAGPEAALTALLDRTVDAALVWSTLEGDPADGYDRGTLHDLVARHVLDMHAIRVIWKSGLIANGPHAVRSDLAPAVKLRLREILIDLSDAHPDAYDAIEPTFGGGFVPISHATYLPLLRLVTPTGTDPMQPPVPRSR
jgi:phosphonate transport system substrate-binding protein